MYAISEVKTGWIQDKLGEDLFTSFHVFKVSFFALCKQSFDISSNILDLVSLKTPTCPNDMEKLSYLSLFWLNT